MKTKNGVPEADGFNSEIIARDNFDMFRYKEPEWKWELVIGDHLRIKTEKHVSVWQRFWTWFFFGKIMHWKEVQQTSGPAQ